MAFPDVLPILDSTPPEIKYMNTPPRIPSKAQLSYRRRKSRASNLIVLYGIKDIKRQFCKKSLQIIFCIKKKYTREHWWKNISLSGAMDWES